MGYNELTPLPLEASEEVKEVSFFVRKNDLVNEYTGSPIPIYGSIMSTIFDEKGELVEAEPIAYLYSDNTIRNKSGVIIEQQDEPELYKPLEQIIREKKIDNLWGIAGQEEKIEGEKGYKDDIDKLIDATELLTKIKTETKTAEYVSGVAQESRDIESGTGNND